MPPPDPSTYALVTKLAAFTGVIPDTKPVKVAAFVDRFKLNISFALDGLFVFPKNKPFALFTI